MIGLEKFNNEFPEWMDGCKGIATIPYYSSAF